MFELPKGSDIDRSLTRGYMPVRISRVHARPLAHIHVRSRMHLNAANEEAHSGKGEFTLSMIVPNRKIKQAKIRKIMRTSFFLPTSDLRKGVTQIIQFVRQESFPLNIFNLIKAYS